MKKYVLFFVVVLSLITFLPASSFSSEAKADDEEILESVATNEEILATPKEEEKKEESAWERSISFGFDKSTGNTDTETWHGGLKILKDVEDYIARFEASGDYGETDDEKTTEKLEGIAEYKYFIDNAKRLYLSGGVEGFHDDMAKIDYKYTLEPSIGYFWFRSDAFSFSTELGPSYVFERVDNENDDYLAPRVAERMDWKITETTTFFETASMDFSVEDSKDYGVDTEVGLDVAINEILSITLGLKNSYSNKPAADTKKNDTQYITALTVKF